MSLTNLIRSAVLGIALAVGCAPSTTTTDENRGNDNAENCEETPFSIPRIRRSFGPAQERLEQEGYEVRSGFWNDKTQFSRLLNYMADDLGCSLSGRRYGGKSCTEIDLSSYHSSALYCGPGAVQCDYSELNPGNCFNRVCYEHDQCYDDLLKETSQICLWSGQTTRCDDNFLEGYDRCAKDDECGFYCQLITAIAVGMEGIEQIYDGAGPGCLWDGDYTAPKDKEDKEPKEKKPKDESLRGLCRDYYEMGLRDCVDDPASPKELEEIIQGICYRPSLTSLERDRERIECAYESNCNDFLDCFNGR